MNRASLNTKVNYPQRGWIHDEYKNNLNRAHTSFNSNPYSNVAGFKHVLLSEVISPMTHPTISDAIHLPKFDRHSGFVDKSSHNKFF